MPLHLTKVAFGAASVDLLAERLRARAAAGPVFLTTRYLPKRHEEVAGQGSLYWIIKHQLVARSPILRFGEAEGGRGRRCGDVRLGMAGPGRLGQHRARLGQAETALEPHCPGLHGFRELGDGGAKLRHPGGKCKPPLPAGPYWVFSGASQAVRGAVLQSP